MAKAGEKARQEQLEDAVRAVDDIIFLFQELAKDTRMEPENGDCAGNPKP